MRRPATTGLIYGAECSVSLREAKLAVSESVGVVSGVWHWDGRCS